MSSGSERYSLLYYEGVVEMMAQKSFDYFDLVGLQALPAYSIKSG
jgi:hypothetical protein